MIETPNRSLWLSEPRLRTGAGHYRDLVRSIVAGKGDRDRMTLAVPPGCEFEVPGSGVTMTSEPASSSWSEGESVRRALMDHDRALVLTSKGAHAAALSGRIRSDADLERVAMLFHWPIRSLMDRSLHRIARRARRSCVALATTSAVAESLRVIGWRWVREVSYPIIAPEWSPVPVQFRHVRVAGPLRFNKGLASIARLLERWAEQRDPIRMSLQATPKHGTRHGRREGPILDRIATIAYPHLDLQSEPLDRARYLDGFRGAITLVAYDPAFFADQVSGVSLDALLCGSPVVASEGTRAADLVREFGAGEIVPFDDVAALDASIRRILDHWHSYSEDACRAASIVARRHHPRRFVEAWLASNRDWGRFGSPSVPATG